MAFPTDLTNAVDGTTEIIAAHLNSLEAKVGINDSVVTSTLDYLVKNVLSVDPGHKHSCAAITTGNLDVGRLPAGGTWGLSSALLVDGNAGIGGNAAFGTSADHVFALGSGTTPTTSPADVVQLYCADRGGTAGTAGLHIRSEDGTCHVFSDRVGIGTTSPLFPLHVVGEQYITSYIQSSNPGNNFRFYSINDDTKRWAIDNTSGYFNIIQYGDGWSVEGTRFVIDRSGNIGIGGISSFGSSAAKVIGLGNGTAPTTSPADVFQMYSYDQTAGNACPHIRTENGAVIKLYKESALTTQLTTITYTEPGTPDYAIADLTNSSPYGFASQDEGRSMLKVIANLQTRISELETRLQSIGLLT